MAGGLTIGGGGSSMPEEGAEMAPESSQGELACESFFKACSSGDFAGAYEAFKEMLMAADAEIGPGSPDEEEPPLPPP